MEKMCCVMKKINRSLSMILAATILLSFIMSLSSVTAYGPNSEEEECTGDGEGERIRERVRDRVGELANIELDVEIARNRIRLRDGDGDGDCDGDQLRDRIRECDEFPIPE